MKKQRIVFLPLVLLVFCSGSNAQDRFEWAPVDTSIWKSAAAQSDSNLDAVMLFEKIEADDRELAEGRCLYTCYRRILILASSGRRWGDVTLPFLHPQQKIRRIAGRVLDADGRIFALSKKHIFRRHAKMADGTRVDLASFSLPAVAAGSLIEYAYTIELPEPLPSWPIQKDIPLRYGEYRWLPYTGGKPDLFAWRERNAKFARPASHPFTALLGAFDALDTDIYRAADDFFELDLFRATGASQTPPFIPDFIWVRAGESATTHIQRRGQVAEELVFTIRDLPPFRREPLSPPDVALKTQLRRYYTPPIPRDAYWQSMYITLREEIAAFTGKNTQQRKILAQLGIRSLPPAEQIDSLYSWLQRTITNITYNPASKNPKVNQYVDDVLKRGYGTQRDINYTFYSMLRALGHHAHLAYVVDRDKNLFLPMARYWQFDRTLVAIQMTEEYFRLYSPGDLFLPPTHVPWFNEGQLAFVVGDSLAEFVHLPYSAPISNRIQQILRTQLDAELNMRGEFIEKRRGLPAQKHRLLLAPNVRDDQRRLLRSHLMRLFPKALLDSCTVQGLANSGQTLVVRSQLRQLGAGSRVGSRALLKPFALIRQSPSPFHSAKRLHPIAFDFALELIETVTVDLGESWAVEALPADTTFTNAVGVCSVAFHDLGKLLSVQRLFRINKPVWSSDMYDAVRELFARQQSFDNMLVILRSISLAEQQARRPSRQ